MGEEAGDLGGLVGGVAGHGFLGFGVYFGGDVEFVGELGVCGFEAVDGGLVVLEGGLGGLGGLLEGEVFGF